MRLFLLLFLVSCSTNIIRSAEMSSFVKDFEKHCRVKVKVPIYWGNLPADKDGQTIGICRGFRQSLLFRSIVIDKKYWDRSTYWERESLVFHELGHCVLDRPHVTAYDEEGHSLSIMHPFTFNTYFQDRPALIKELCSKF